MAKIQCLRPLILFSGQTDTNNFSFVENENLKYNFSSLVLMNILQSLQANPPG